MSRDNSGSLTSPFTFSNFNTADLYSVVVQPQFIRRRAALRSPIESVKFNQDDSQFRFDIVKLLRFLNDEDRAITTTLSMRFSEQSAFSDIDINDPEGGMMDLVVPSIESLSQRLTSIGRRLQNLQRGL